MRRTPLVMKVLESQTKPAPGASPIKITAIQRNKPAQLVFLTSSVLAAGTYWLEVRARTGNVSDVRVGRLDAVLTVA